MDNTADATEENENIESLVLLALSKLQREKKVSKKLENFVGFSARKIAGHLKISYCWLDGDIESQVKTALLSCLKTGLVCILNSGKYRLVGPNSKAMVSNCMTRTSHGSKCCCMRILKGFLKTRICCYKKKTPSQRRTKPVQKSSGKPKTVQAKSRQTGKVEQKKKACLKKKMLTAKCALEAQKLIGTDRSELAVEGGKDLTDKTCEYCMEIHSLPNLKKLCTNCYPVGGTGGTTFNNFSPRDER